MPSPLFRQEVLDTSRSQWTGAIVLARPVPIRLAAAISLALAALLLLLLVFGEYTRKVHVSGQLVPASGVIKAEATQSGRVVARNVADGDIVAEGQVLYELSAERTNRDGGIDARISASLAARRRLLADEADLQARQCQQRQLSLKARHALMESEIVRASQEIALQGGRVLNAQRMATRYRTLRQQGFVSELQLSQIENDQNEQQARSAALQRALSVSRRELVQNEEDSHEAESQMQLGASQVARALAALDQEAAEHQGRSHVQVLAPAAGVVSPLTVELGQSVQAGVVVASIIPAGSEMQARLLVPSRAVGFIEPGQEVLLRMAAFPYQKFGQVRGTVLRVERSPIAEAGTQAAGLTDTMYRVTVKLSRQSVRAYGKEQAYKAGMTFEADIQQDRRRLIEWVLDPLLSFARKS